MNVEMATNMAGEAGSAPAYTELTARPFTKSGTRQIYVALVP